MLKVNKKFTYKRVSISLSLEAIEALRKLSVKYKVTKSEVIRNMLIKRQNLKTLKSLERQIEKNKEAQLLISRIPANINQIAHRLNEEKYYEALTEFQIDNFNEICKQLLQEVKWLSLELKRNNVMLENLY